MPNKSRCSEKFCFVPICAWHAAIFAQISTTQIFPVLLALGVLSTLRIMSEETNLKSIVLEPNEGRKYPMGRMSAVFKADLGETNSTLSVSEWWLEANTEGPHIHKHPEAHLFYVIEGDLFMYLEGKDWFEAKKGSYIYIPGETEHGFENRSNLKVGFISINTPGGFEQAMPNIANYFEESPLGDAKKNTIQACQKDAPDVAAFTKVLSAHDEND